MGKADMSESIGQSFAGSGGEYLGFAEMVLERFDIMWSERHGDFDM